MNNVLAIARKELKGYFASPIAYIVIGFSAILYGWFFINLLYYFDRMSLQAGAGMGGPEAVNVNDMLISPLFLNVTVILLFTLPLVTMRTYSEEKRSGTIELLLTSPLTDVQIVIGKFLGAFVLYAAMLEGFGSAESLIGMHAETIIRRQIAHGPYPSAHIYGDGHAGPRIADLLARVPLHVQKRIQY